MYVLRQDGVHPILELEDGVPADLAMVEETTRRKETK